MEQQTLFGLPDYIAQPRHHDGTYAPKCDGAPQANVKRHLEAGLKITVLQCIKLYGSTELRRIINRLKKRGMNILSEPYIENGRVKYHIYSLAKEEKDVQVKGN